MTVLAFTPLAPKGHNYVASRASIRAMRGEFTVATSKAPTGDYPGIEEKLARILEAYQSGRRKCLAGEYTALLTVESDVIIPVDALEKLLTVDAGIVYGLYCLRSSGEHEWNLHRPGQKGGPYLNKSYSRNELASSFLGQILPVGGLGQGCCLIRREVLEQIGFRWDPLMPYMAPDWGLAVDATSAGITQMGHAGVVCGHIMHEGQGVLWPAANKAGYVIRELRDTRRY